MNEKKDISMETKEEGLQEQILAERFSLCRERISQIGEEELAEEAFRDYFVNTAKQIELFVQEYFNVAEDGLRKPVSGNCRRITAGFIRMSFLKIMEKAMRTLLLQRRPWERNSGRFCLFWRQSKEALSPLPMNRIWNPW